MKGVRIHAHGGPEALRIEEVADPAPRGGEVALDVHAVALNHLDIWVRKGVPGASFPLPITPGCDIAGVVAAVGDGVDGIEPGMEAVLAPGLSCGRCRACASGRDHHCRSYGILGEHRDGGCAERVVVPHVNVLPKPPGLSFEEAAAVPLVFLTAWGMLVDRAGLRPGETVLVHAAGSGVSSAAIQIAKLHGATVITTSSTEEKRKRALALGADRAIPYDDFPKEVKSLTSGRGAEVVIDHVGEATWEGSLEALAWQGRLVTCGATTGADARVNLAHLFYKSLSLLGSTMGSRGSLCGILDHVAAGRLKPVVDRTLPLDEVREGHRLLEAREAFGKVVLVP